MLQRQITTLEDFWFRTNLEMNLIFPFKRTSCQRLNKSNQIRNELFLGNKYAFDTWILRVTCEGLVIFLESFGLLFCLRMLVKKIMCSSCG